MIWAIIGSEAACEVALENPVPARLLEHGDDVRPLPHPRTERDRRPHVGTEVEVLQPIAQRVLTEVLAGGAKSGGDDLADAPPNEPEVVGRLVGVLLPVGVLVPRRPRAGAGEPR